MSNQSVILRQILLRRPAKRNLRHDPICQGLRKTKAPSPQIAYEMQLLARDLAGHRKHFDITLTTGLGLSERGVPLRLPALIAPGIEILRDLKELGISKVKYIVYQASDFISEANALKSSKAQRNSALSMSYLQTFIDNFFPEEREDVVLVAGENCKINKTELNALADFIDKERPAEIADEISMIEKYGEKHSSDKKTSILYASANVILNGGYAPYYPLSGHLSSTANFIVPLGGAKEKPFFNITRHISQITNCRYNVIPLLIPTGACPTYYPYQKGDILVGESRDCVETFLPPEETKSDFFTLKKLGANVEALYELSLEVLEKQKNAQIPQRSRSNRNLGGDGPASKL